MTTQTRRKATFYLVSIFLVGTATGALVGYTSAKKRKPPSPPRVEDMTGHITARLRDKLILSSEQVARIEPLVRRACSEMQSIQRDSGKRMGQVFQDLSQRMAEYLSPEQREKLEKMERERQESWRNRSRPLEKTRGPPGGIGASNCAPGAAMH